VSSHRKFIKEIERRAGVEIVSVEHCGSGHLRLLLPCGATVIASSTSGSRFIEQLTVTKIRRAIRNTNHQGGHRAQ
jgi:hypothetical protein